MPKRTAFLLPVLLAACAPAEPPPKPVAAPAPPPSTITLTNADRTSMAEALARAVALPVGETATWTGDAGKAGAVTTVREGYARGGELCREYHAAVAQADLRLQEVGFVCLDAAGAWKVVDPEVGTL